MQLNLETVPSLKLIVSADPDDHPSPDTEVIDLSKVGTPYRLYIASFSARSGIGAVWVQLKSSFSSSSSRLGIPAIWQWFGSPRSHPKKARPTGFGKHVVAPGAHEWVTS